VFHPAALQSLLRTGGIIALKARMLSQMAPLHTFLVTRLGATAGNIAASTLATAAAAAYIAQKEGKSPEEVERAAAESAGTSAGREIAAWVREHLI